MKKLLLAVLFLGGLTAQANTVTDLDHTAKKGIRYNQPQSITFVERGVQFTVFVNGQFDFNRNRSRYQNSNTGRRGYGVNAPGHTYGVSYPYAHNTFVRYDRNGNAHKVGRNQIRYNRQGKVNQIGSVTLRYKNGRLVRAGDTQIVYNRRGRIVQLRDTRARIHNIKNNKRQRFHMNGRNDD